MITSPHLQREMARLIQAYKRSSDPTLALEMFRALGWDKGDCRLEQSRHDGARGEYRLLVAGEATAYLFTAPHEPGDKLVRAAANVAYNSGIDWAAVTNFGVTKVVHARWSDDPTYLSMPWTEYRQRLDQLELLSPQSIVDGRLAEAAHASENQRHVVRPVDQHLMERLGHWRRLLLGYSRSVTDQQVHELIGRLFFIRSCEDRGIIPTDTLLALQRQAAPESSLDQALSDLFAQLAVHFDSELFINTNGQPPVFDDTVLSKIIQDLYSPFPGLPHYRYDFSYLNVDVLGKVYERYVSTILESVPKDNNGQLPLFDLAEPEQEIEVHSRRREQGIYYTPPYMVNYIVQHTVEPLLKEARTMDEFPRVADISCGSGAFLTRSAERMVSHARELGRNGTSQNWARRSIAQIIGVDLDPRAVTLARVNLWILATMGEPPRPLPELGESVFADDALGSHQLDALKGQLDVVVGNPPFRSAAELDRAEHERLRRRYISASGRFDLAYVFMERALQLVRPGGYVGFVLPNRLFTNAAAAFLREHLTETTTIEKVVDFGHQSAFEEGLSYTTILIVRKVSRAGESDGMPAPPVQVHQVLRLAQYPGLQLRRADLINGTEWRNDDSHIFMAPQPADGRPWIWWASDTDDRIRQKLASEANTLGEIALLRQGVKTGENDVFILRKVGANTRTGRWLLRNQEGEQVELEPDLLRPCAFGTAITRYAASEEPGHNSMGHTDFVLYPYRGRRLVDLLDIRDRFPDTYRYLMRYKERLQRRATVKLGGAWHGLSRARADEWLDQPKLITRVLVRPATFMADEQGECVPIGGLALVPHDTKRIPLALLLGVLNSSLATWYLIHHAAHFQGDYLQVTRGELMNFPFPWERLLGEQALARRIASLAEGAVRSAQFGLSVREADAEIDAILFDIVGLDAEEQQAIQDQVAWRLQAEVQTSAIRPFDGVRTVGERLAVVADLLTQAEVTGEQRRRASLLLQARDGLLSVFRMPDTGISNMGRSLLAFALLGTEQLAKTRVTDMQLTLLRDLVSGSSADNISPEVVRRYARRLREMGIEVVPSIPRASLVLGDGHSASGRSSG